MAFKCWKKTTDNSDGKSFYKIKSISGIDVGTSVHILLPSSTFTSDSKIHVRAFERRRGVVVDKSFLKESLALKFAKAYMKKNDRC